MKSRKFVFLLTCMSGLVAVPMLALADNCGSPSDCFGVAGSFNIAVTALLALAALSILLDFLPYIGTIKGVIEAVEGRDLITGQELSWWERSLGVIPIIGGVAAVAGVTRAARTVDRVTEGADAVRDAARVPGAGSIRNVNPMRGTRNCVNCSIATDATLAGRPASALPGGPTSITVLERQYGGTFRRVAGRGEVETIVSAAGPGARGIVFGARGDDVGHVFNVVNQNGVIRFLDGQTGKVASFEGFTSFLFSLTN